MLEIIVMLGYLCLALFVYLVIGLGSFYVGFGVAVCFIVGGVGIGPASVAAALASLTMALVLLKMNDIVMEE